MSDIGVPRRFKLVRHEDESGVSGTGVVAYGVEFADGYCTLQWLNDQNPNVETERNGLASYPGGVEDVEEVHGHDGRTQVEWIDDALN